MLLPVASPEIETRLQLVRTLDRAAIGEVHDHGRFGSIRRPFCLSLCIRIAHSCTTEPDILVIWGDDVGIWHISA